MNKVDELVEWVADIIDIDCQLCTYSPNSGYPEKCFVVPETTPCKRRMDIANQILKDSALAIVDRDAKLPSVFDADENVISALEYKKKLTDYVKEIK